MRPGKRGCGEPRVHSGSETPSTCVRPCTASLDECTPQGTVARCTDSQSVHTLGNPVIPGRRARHVRQSLSISSPSRLSGTLLRPRAGPRRAAAPRFHPNVCPREIIIDARSSQAQKVKSQPTAQIQRISLALAEGAIQSELILRLDDMANPLSLSHTHNATYINVHPFKNWIFQNITEVLPRRPAMFLYAYILYLKQRRNAGGPTVARGP